MDTAESAADETEVAPEEDEDAAVAVAVVVADDDVGDSISKKS